MKYFIVSVFVWIVCIVCIEARAQQADTTLGEIRGRVIDARTKKPQLYSSIWLQSGGVTIAKTICDSEGAYAIRNILPGEYKLLSYGSGCENITVVEKVKVVAGEISFYDIRPELCKERKGTWYSQIQTTWTDIKPAYLSDSVYSRVGWVWGRVTDAETGEPMPFVSVQLECQGYTGAQVLTDSLGRYMFTSVPLGQYVVRTSYAEYKCTVIMDVVLHDCHKIDVNDIRLEKGVGMVYKNPEETIKPKPLTDPDGKSGRTYTAEELERLPLR